MSVEAKYFEQLAEIHKASAEYYRKVKKQPPDLTAGEFNRSE